MDFDWLDRYMMMHRAENQTYSRPFIVKLKTQAKAAVWFWYGMTGINESDVYIHIWRIFVADEALNVTSQDVVLDVPSQVMESNFALLDEYMEDLKAVDRDFSEEKMDALLQEKALVTMFNAYQTVKLYVQSRYPEV